MSFPKFLGLMLVFGVVPGATLSSGQTTATLYKSKCVACHGTDGSGSPIGKKLGTHDFRGADVQKESDTELIDAIGKGRNKMPAYEKALNPDEIKGLVAYIRSLGRDK